MATPSTNPALDKDGKGLARQIEERTAQLRNSPEILDLFANQLPEAFWIRESGEDRRLVYVNATWERFTGVAVAPGEGLESMLRCVHPQDLEKVRAGIERHPNGGAEAVARFVRVDGEVRWAHVRTFPLHDQAGALRWVAGILEDITASKRAEEALRETEAQFRALVEQSLVGIYIRDGDRLEYASPRLLEILGCDPRKLREATFADLVLEEDQPILGSVLARRAAGETGPIRVTCRVYRGDGQVRHLEVESKVIEIRGRPEILGIVQDVTERERAAEDLRLSEEKYRVLWETSTDAVVLVDDDGVIRYANPSVRTVFGFAPEELEGQHVHVLQPVRSRREHDAAMGRYLETGERKLDWRRVEFIARHRDGHEFPIEISFSRLRVAGKSLFAAFLRDISERKAAEAALEHAYARMEALSQRVLEVQEEERRSLSLELHDDVGQSLVALRIGLHRLGSELTREQAQLLAECDELVAKTQERLRELAQALHPPQLEELGLREALAGLAERQRVVTGLDIRCAFAAEDPEPELAPNVQSACYRICQEALNNATRHAHARCIEIGLGMRAAEAQLWIADDGVGFDPQAQRGRAAKSGTLGLVGMEQRARRAGGRLELQSAPGSGTRVVASFPLIAAGGPAP